MQTHGFTTSAIALCVLFTGSLVSLTACQRPEPTKVKVDATATTSDVIVANEPASIPPAISGLKKSDFPVYLAGVPSLLHPIIPSVPLAPDSKSASKDNVRGDTASYFSQISPYTFQSNIYNVVFEDIATGNTQRLFAQDNFVIKSVVLPFVEMPVGKNLVSKAPVKSNVTTRTIQDASEPALVGVAETTGTVDSKSLTQANKKLMGYIFYQVKEKASDDNTKTNIDDQLALYMSDDSGKNLTKLHPNDQYVKATQWLPELQRFYFTTQADTNHDNVIDDNDKYFNYVIDFKQAKLASKDGKTVLPKAIGYSFMK